MNGLSTYTQRDKATHGARFPENQAKLQPQSPIWNSQIFQTNQYTMRVIIIGLRDQYEVLANLWWIEIPAECNWGLIA